MAKIIKKQKVTLQSLSKTMIAGFTAIDKKFDAVDKKIDSRFGILDKKIDSRFGILDKKIDMLDKKIEGEVENLAQMTQGYIVKSNERFDRIEKDISELKDGQARIETNLVGAARKIDLMDLKAEVEILKRKV